MAVIRLTFSVLLTEVNRLITFAPQFENSNFNAYRMLWDSMEFIFASVKSLH